METLKNLSDLRREAENLLNVMRERFPGEDKPYTLILDEALHILRREAQIAARTKIYK